jgi:hypothetical protein
LRVQAVSDLEAEKSTDVAADAVIDRPPVGMRSQALIKFVE